MKMGNSSNNAARYERLGRILAMASGMEPYAGQCPAPEQLAALMDRGLDGKELDTVLGHLAGCDRCREVLITAVRLSAEDKARDVKPGWRFGFLVPYAAAAAVLIAVVSAALVYRGHMAPSGVQVAKQYAPAAEKNSGPHVDKGTGEPTPPVTEKQEEQKAKAIRAPAPAPVRDSPVLSNKPAGGAKSDEGYALKKNTRLPAKAGNMEKEQPARRTAPPPGASEPARGMMGFSEPSADGMDNLTPPAGIQQAPRMLVKPGGKSALSELPAAPVEAAKPQAQSEVVKAKGVIMSLDLENGELEFLPEGEKIKVQLMVDPALLEGLQPGDKVLVVYEKSNTNVATRIKRERVIIVPVGC